MQDEINILQTNINTNCNSRDGNDCDDLIAEVQRLRDENSSLLKIIEELTTQQNASNSKQLNTTNPPAQQNQHHLQHSQPRQTPANHNQPCFRPTPNYGWEEEVVGRPVFWRSYSDSPGHTYNKM
ncbi:hypothetical protein Bbelb_319570 [Branchiostoma belcheri]|nr:hypothetical protein Bbelb_319570 [Branchiostoma belcheri]